MLSVVRTFIALLVAAAAGFGQPVPPTPKPPPPTFTLSPDRLAFSYEIGSPVPASQSVLVEVEDNAPTSFTATALDAWLSVTPGHASAPATVRVSVNPAGLAPGFHEGRILVTSEGAPLEPQVLRVQLSVRERPQLLPLSEALTFNFESGGVRPSPATLYLTAKGSQVRFSAAASSQGNWLAVSPGSGQTPANLAVAVDPSGLAPNTYTGAITISSAEATNSPRTVAVTLVVAAPAPAFAAAGIVNSASFQPGPVAPGEVVVIGGSGLGPETLAAARLEGSSALGAALAETRVLFDGAAAPLVYTQARQLAVVVPYSVAGRDRTEVEVEFRGRRSTRITVPVAAAAPGIFTLDGSGRGQGAILNQDGTVNSPSNPAPRNSVVVLYATGEGQTDPAGADGRIAVNVLPRPLLPVSVRIGGEAAEVLYAGAAPGLFAGVVQLNVRVPDGFAPGNAVPVVVSFGTFSSPAGVTLAVRNETTSP